MNNYFKRYILHKLRIAERIKNGKCPITGNNCMCACVESCFIDVETNDVIAKMTQTAFNSAVNAVSNPQLNNLPTGAKLDVADKIITLSKIRIGKKQISSIF